MREQKKNNQKDKNKQIALTKKKQNENMLMNGVDYGVSAGFLCSWCRFAS